MSAPTPSDSAPPPRAPHLADPALGFVLLFAGLVVLAVTARIETAAQAKVPWKDLVVAPNADPLWDGAFPLRARRVDIENFPEEKLLLDRLRAQNQSQLADGLGLGRTEWVLSVDIPPGQLQPLLASGRQPVPGKYEVLAGALARRDDFMLNNHQFKVVGRIHANVPGLAFAYLLPKDLFLERLFRDQLGGSAGWLDPAGADKLKPLLEANAVPQSAQIINPAVPMAPAHIWGSIIGLILVAMGGSLIFVRLFQSLAGRFGGPLQPICREAEDHAFLLGALHVLLYGVFFAAMAAATRSPVDNMRIQGLVAQAFQEGHLQYLTQSFEDSDIPRTAFWIFFNNYIVQTVALTVLASCIIPYIGVLKTLASLLLVGFAMAPIWSGAPGHMVYHAITMVLEFEGYILACFAVCMLPLKIFGADSDLTFSRRLVPGFYCLLSGALVAGIILAAAAFYEAATLVFFRT